MEPILTSNSERREDAYRGLSLRDRLELLAFDARLAGVLLGLLEALGRRSTGCRALAMNVQ
jgi:hypothetical protein